MVTEKLRATVPHRLRPCDCSLDERTAGIRPANARDRGFVEIEILHAPEFRSVFYACVRCGRRFEAFYESGMFYFLPVLGD